MPSERKPLQRTQAEWILLSEDQKQILASKIEELIEGLENENFDGVGRFTDIVKSVRSNVLRSARISTKQLSMIQKGWTKTLKEDLYVPGLEGYLLENEEKMSQLRKMGKTRRERYGE